MVGIHTGKLFGAVAYDVRVDKRDKEKIAEMPPIFKNTQITIDDVGPFMKNFMKNWVSLKLRDVR